MYYKCSLYSNNTTSFVYKAAAKEDRTQKGRSHRMSTSNSIYRVITATQGNPLMQTCSETRPQREQFHKQTTLLLACCGKPPPRKDHQNVSFAKSSHSGPQLNIFNVSYFPKIGVLSKAQEEYDIYPDKEVFVN